MLREILSTDLREESAYARSKKWVENTKAKKIRNARRFTHRIETERVP